jgi:hypothetical protein
MLAVGAGLEVGAEVAWVMVGSVKPIAMIMLKLTAIRST